MKDINRLNKNSRDQKMSEVRKMGLTADQILQKKRLVKSRNNITYSNKYRQKTD